VSRGDDSTQKSKKYEIFPKKNLCRKSMVMVDSGEDERRRQMAGRGGRDGGETDECGREG
jgi:hypothetical protein